MLVSSMLIIISTRMFIIRLLKISLLVKEVFGGTQQCHFVTKMVIVMELGRILTLSLKMFLLHTCNINAQWMLFSQYNCVYVTKSETEAVCISKYYNNYFLCCFHCFQCMYQDVFIYKFLSGLIKSCAPNPCNKKVVVEVSQNNTLRKAIIMMV